MSTCAALPRSVARAVVTTFVACRGGPKGEGGWLFLLGILELPERERHEEPRLRAALLSGGGEPAGGGERRRRGGAERRAGRRSGPRWEARPGEFAPRIAVPAGTMRLGCASE